MESKRAAIYVRVSTVEQQTDLQEVNTVVACLNVTDPLGVPPYCPFTLAVTLTAWFS